ncbi:uncharacterized protein LOC144199987 [Stigmatopora nigra]
MAEKLKNLVSENKALVESVMEVFEKGAEVVASLVGDFFPIFSIAAPIVQLALDNVESKEAVYMKEQFQKVRDRLDAVSDQTRHIHGEIQRSGVDIEYFSVEEDISNQFRKYMDILNAKPKFREVKKKLFLEDFERVGGDKNLHTLYDAVTGDNFGSRSVLEVMLECEEKSRRALEDFCVRLKHLFCLGIIALMGHAALKGYSGEKALLDKWGAKMKVVQEKMDTAIQVCVRDFEAQAQLDTRRLLRDAPDRGHRQLAEYLLAHLRKKFDWVGWSVRVFGAPTGFRSSKKFHCAAGKNSFLSPKKFHCAAGKNRFRVSWADDKLNVHVSFGPRTTPVDRTGIQQLLAGHKKTKASTVAEALFALGSGPVAVHVVLAAAKEPVCVWSFPDETHYWELHGKRLYVCLHSA